MKKKMFILLAYIEHKIAENTIQIKSLYLLMFYCGEI